SELNGSSSIKRSYCPPSTHARLRRFSSPRLSFRGLSSFFPYSFTDESTVKGSSPHDVHSSSRVRPVIWDSGNWKETITDVTPSMSIEPEKELKSPDNSSASVDFPLPIFPLIRWTPSLKVPRAESDHSPRIARTESIVIFIVSTSMTMDNTVCRQAKQRRIPVCRQNRHFRFPDTRGDLRRM